MNHYLGGNGDGPGTGLGNIVNDVPGVQVVQDWTPNFDVMQLNGSGFTSFDDVLSHGYQNGAYFVVQVDADTTVWLNGATSSTISAANFAIAR